MIKGKSCFIIMPFSKVKIKEEEYDSSDLDFIYTDVIKRAIDEFNLDGKPFFSEVSRYNSSVGSIVSGIIDRLNIADVVIADLTGLNPNVMYELGVRHTLKRGTIIITQDVNTLPSDLRDYIFIQYDYSMITTKQKENYRSFKDKLHKALQEVLTTNRADSPVLTYLQNRQRFWAQDEIELIKENIVIYGYIVERYDSIKDLLKQISNDKDLAKARIHFLRLYGLISNLSVAMGDINIPIETTILYENINSAKQLIGDVDKKINQADYFSDFFEQVPTSDAKSFKERFFKQIYIDYFKLDDGLYHELSLPDIFSDDGDFYSLFIEDLGEYLDKKVIEFGISEDEIDFMQTN